MHRRRQYLGAAAVATALILVGTACGSSSKKTPNAATGGTTATNSGGGGACNQPVDTSADSQAGNGAGLMQWSIQCAAEKPLKATGDPLVIGWQNAEGDPAGTFPEYTTAAKAAIDYVNNTLGGVGADLKAGKPGRPLKLQVCNMTINPADSQKCANELASAKPFAVVSTINFFGNNLPIYLAAKIPTFVLTPITVADFTTDGIFSIGAGGGCVGAHTGLVEFITHDLGAKKIGVPWADTPPGVVCYYDLEKKPLDILAGTADGPAAAKGKIAGLTELGVPIKPAQPDITPQVSQVLSYKPDAMMFSAQDSDCWSLVNTLGKLGWTTAKIPLVMSGSCIDTDKAKEAGDLAKGIYFIGSPPFSQPDLLDGVLKVESQTYLDQMKKANATDDQSKGFAVQGFQGVMELYQFISATAQKNGGIASVTPDTLTSYMKSTSNVHPYGGTPLGCADAVPSYKAVCASTVTAIQWDGSKYQIKRPNFSGTYIISGTKILTGP